MRYAKDFEELQAKIAGIFASSPARDIERNLKALLSSFLTRLDLVSREEFDVQREVLLRTREKLEQLEKKIAELEGTAARPRANGVEPGLSDAPFLSSVGGDSGQSPR